MAENVYDIGIGTSIDSKGLKRDLKSADKQIKDFASGASKSLTGIDFTKLVIPAALATASVAALSKLKSQLDDMADSYREQEKAEVALQNAAKNNVYLNDNSVKQLNRFANEMQKLTGIDNVAILQTQTKLASLGRNQEQIQKIVKTAADMAAAGVMGFDEAVNELNNSLNGMVRTSGRLYPELKNLSNTALASGEAIDIIASKVAGSAAKAMETGAGSVLAYKNAVGDLRKLYGEDWERTTSGMRTALTNWINKIVEARTESNDLRKALEAIQKGGDSSAYETVFSITLKRAEEDLARMKSSLEAYIITMGGNEATLNRAARERVEADRAEIARLEGLIPYYKERNEIAKQLAEIEDEVTKKIKMLQEVNDLEGTLESQNNLNIALRHSANIIGDIRSAYTELERGYNEGAQRRLTEGIIVQETERFKIITEGVEAELEATRKRTDAERSAAEFRKENQKLLNEEIEKIYRRAELEGKNKKSLEVQKQVLDAQVQAYENLLSAAKGYIEGATQSEEERKKFMDSFIASEDEHFGQLKRRWAAYSEQAETEKRTDEQRKQRLAELVKQQEDAQTALNKILQDVTGEARIIEEERIQKEIAKVREKSAKEGIERQAQNEIKLLHETQAEKLKENERQMQIALAAQGELERTTLANTKLTEEEITEIKRKGEVDRAQIVREFNTRRESIVQNSAQREIQIEEEKTEAIKRLYVDLWKKNISLAQEYQNAASQLANNIGTIWKNNIDFELNEKLRQNDALIQSDEERAAIEKDLMKQAAEERYKADYFMWMSNIILATGQTAMAIMNALSTVQPWPAAIAAAAVSAVMGTVQVAAVASAKPQRPRFHTGGVVQGSGEVPATLMSGEIVTTAKQFDNVMQAFANMANLKSGGGNTQLVVNVKNNAANMVSTSQSYNDGEFELVINRKMNKMLSEGKFDPGLNAQRQRSGGFAVDNS